MNRAFVLNELDASYKAEMIVSNELSPQDAHQSGADYVPPEHPRGTWRARVYNAAGKVIAEAVCKPGDVGEFGMNEKDNAIDSAIEKARLAGGVAKGPVSREQKLESQVEKLTKIVDGLANKPSSKDERTDSEREADEQAALARKQIAAKKKSK